MKQVINLTGLKHMKTTVRNIILIIAAVFSLFFRSYAQEEWVVPEEKIDNTAPFSFSQDIEKAGQKIYNSNCQSCHGTPGKENYIALNPIPDDLSMAKAQDQKDGALYYKITEGRGPMPSFKNILSADQRWTVIAYLRSFNKAYIQPSTEQASQFSGADIILALEYQQEEHLLTATVNENLKHNEIGPAVAGIELAFYVKRYFGDLKIDEEKTTNNQGQATFAVPTNLPGDEEGNLVGYIKIANNDVYSNVKEEITLFTGTKADTTPLTEKRALWNSMRKIPLWLLFSYLIVVLGVFGTIGYTLHLVRLIYLEGKNSTNLNHQK